MHGREDLGRETLLSPSSEDVFSIIAIWKNTHLKGMLAVGFGRSFTKFHKMVLKSKPQAPVEVEVFADETQGK